MIKHLTSAVIIAVIIYAGLNWRLIATIARPNLVNSSAAVAQVDQLPNNTLSIPKIGLQAPIIPSAVDPSNSQDWSVIRNDLTKGVSLAEKLPLPGETGTTVITGHSSDWWPHRYAAIFANLDRLATGDEILLKYNDILYRYQVVDQAVVTPADQKLQTDHLTTGDHQLYLVTCWPRLTTTKRRIVTAIPAQP